MKNITPIFVSGIGRSGTSALIAALSTHSEIVEPENIGEAPFVHHFLEFLSQFEDRSNSKDYNLKNYKLNESDRYREFARLMALVQYGVDVYHAENEDRFWIAKLSLDLTQKRKADQVFGESRIVYIVRNGIEVVNSAKSFSGFQHSTFKELCFRWVDNQKKCSYVEESQNCVLVKHHELVSNPDAVFDTVYKALNIGSDSNPANFIKTNLFNSSFDNTAKNTDTTNAFSDRLRCWNDWSEEEKCTFIDICDDAMVQYDFTRPYTLSDGKNGEIPGSAVEDTDHDGGNEGYIRKYG